MRFRGEIEVGFFISMCLVFNIILLESEKGCYLSGSVFYYQVLPVKFMTKNEHENFVNKR